MKIYFLLIIVLISNYFITAQQQDSTFVPPHTKDTISKSLNAKDSLFKTILEHPELIDSLRLKIRSVIISGNKTTKDYIILREMTLKQGGIFTIDEYQKSLLNIYNLNLFLKVDIFPIPVSKNELILNVDVQERWYIFPLPQFGMDDGEWAKKWIGLNLIWDNVRGRNERLFLQFRFLYNPAIQGFYTIPWIGDNLHFSATIGAGYADNRNQSLTAVGKINGTNTLTEDDANFDNKQYFTQLSFAKYITRKLNINTNLSYNYLRVSQYQPGRTLSLTGKDKYIGIGLGFGFDSRNIFEYTTKGYYLSVNYTRFGFIDHIVSYGKFNIESKDFIPVNFSKSFFITIASRLYTSLLVGANLPYYTHTYLGYSDDYIRGWRGKAYEGEDKFTLYNEIRIPLLTPRYINAEKIPVVRNLPYLQRMDLKHGLYFTLIYDVGAVWFNTQRIQDVSFKSGTGIGLNAVLPFGYVFRLEWTVCIAKPAVGQVVLTLNAKF